MADLRIVDAPEIPTNSITGQEKLPTGGSGNYSITLDSVSDYTKTKKDLVNTTTVDGKVNGVRQELNTHVEDLLNPHQVTKGQIGLGNVDNTSDADKPVSNSTQAAIISAVSPKADKTYVDAALSSNIDKTYVDAALSSKAEKTYVDTALSSKTDKTYVDNQLSLKANEADVYTKQESSDLVSNSISTALTPINTSLDLAKRGIANRYDSSLTYNLGERVVLTNGYIVKSAVNGNTNDPNVNMTGWAYSSLTPSNNLSDVADEAEARTNLDVYSKDEVNTAIATSVPIVADATTIDKGIVRLATASDITNSSETAVVTPKNVANMLVGVGSLAKGFRALFSARLTQMTGTNTSNNKTITCTITAHGLSVGDVVSVNYWYRDAMTNYNATDTVTVMSVANANTFTFISPQAATGSVSASTCTLYYVIKNNYNVNSLAINSVGRYTISINAASGITGANFIPFIEATTSDNSLVIVQPEAITSATSLTVRTFNAAGTAIVPQWLHIGVTQ